MKIINCEETRPFTVREYARIQTFPDECINFISNHRKTIDIFDVYCFKTFFTIFPELPVIVKKYIPLLI
jgi:hypothetical protein